MKVTMPDGTVMHVSFANPNGATGYVADKIEIDADDVRTMHAMSHSNPDLFCKFMLQLENRFTSRRLFNDESTTKH